MFLTVSSISSCHLTLSRSRPLNTAAYNNAKLAWVCSFGLFNFDSYVSFRAIVVIWGIRELVAELVHLLISSLCLVLTLWEANIQDMKPNRTWISREKGRLHGAYEHSRGREE